MRKLLAALTLVLFSSACQPAVNPEFAGIVDVTYPLMDIMGKPYCTATKIKPNTFLTAAHCLGNPTGGLILGKDGVLKTFKVVKADEANDLALITAEAAGPAADVASVELPLYTRVVAAGYPYGVALYITEGLWVGPVLDGRLDGHAGVGIDVAPGNSGGGIFVNINGGWKLVAVVQMKAGSEGHVALVSAQATLKEFLRG